MTGVHLPAHQIKGAISDNFLERKGSVGERSEKGSFGVRLHKTKAILTHFFENFPCDL